MLRYQVRNLALLAGNSVSFSPQPIGSVRTNKKPAVSGGVLWSFPNCLLAGAAEALDALAGFLEQSFRGRIGNAEVRAKTERRAMNNGNAL